MAERVAMLIIEPRALLREALVSLMASHSFHVVGGVGSAAEIDKSLLVADLPKLVIIGALRPEEATTTASSVRTLWPESKIVLLFEHASPAAFQTLLASEIDACIPLVASTETLIGTLQQIIAADLRILVRGTALARPTRWQDEGDGFDLGVEDLLRLDIPKVASRLAFTLSSARSPIATVVTKRVAAGDVSSSGNFHGLS